MSPLSSSVEEKAPGPKRRKRSHVANSDEKDKEENVESTLEVLEAVDRFLLSIVQLWRSSNHNDFGSSLKCVFALSSTNKQAFLRNISDLLRETQDSGSRMKVGPFCLLTTCCFTQRICCSNSHDFVLDVSIVPFWCCSPSVLSPSGFLPRARI